MGCHVTFNFSLRNVKLAGWGLNFWHNSSDIPTVKIAAAALALPLYDMTANQVTVASARISQDGGFRLTDTLQIGTTATAPPSPSTDADYVTTAHQLKLLAFNGRRATVWVSGLPDAITQNSGVYTPTGKYATALTQLFTRLAADGWALRGLPRPQVFRDISAFDQLAGLVTAKAHGFGPPGTVLRVRVKQVKFLPGINGIWKITVIDADTFKLAGWTSIAVPLPIGLKTAVCAQQVYDYSPIVFSTDVSKPTSKAGIISSHKRGRPQDLLGGRRKRRST